MLLYPDDNRKTLFFTYADSKSLTAHRNTHIMLDQKLSQTDCHSDRKIVKKKTEPLQ